jgi:hypothetical protein
MVDGSVAEIASPGGTKPSDRRPVSAQAKLARASTRVAHGENRQRMPFAARAFRAALGMIADRPLQQRAAQDLAGHREPVVTRGR